MDNIKNLKNTINNNDFFKLRQSEGNDNKRIYDIEIFNQIKYNNNNNYKNINNINTNNYYNLKSNINEFQNNDNNLENRNYFQDNQNKNLDYIFSNDIEAENNIGKYKKKILNRSNIVEQNYKNFNEYQNNKYKRINLRYTQEQYDNNNPIDNIKNRNNDNILSSNIPNSDFNYVNKDNNNYNINRNNHRIYKSHSLGNLFQTNFYLSDQNQNYNHIKNKEYMGKKRTDITDDELINMKDYNENGFYDYCNKKLEILMDNKKMVEDKLEQEKLNKNKSRLQEQNEIKIKNKYFNNLNIQNLMEIKNSKIKYKNILDEQIKNNINNKLLNENLTFKDIVQNQFYLVRKNGTPDRKFLNKNRFVEINPYNHRNYYLGNSSLQNNTITNPKVQYKYNRYIFPKISSKNNKE